MVDGVDRVDRVDGTGASFSLEFLVYCWGT